MPTRRALLATGLVVASAALARPVRAAGATQLRIGYQKNGLLVIAKQHGTIEARLRPLGVAVSWTEFSLGPPILEALRAGAIDYGQTGDTPPIFAQAARSDLVYVAAQPDSSSASAVLVPPGSKLQSLAELKGKRVAFSKASSAHNLTVAALEKAGLAYSDIQPEYLVPADAAAAFARGAVDAWTVWDPYYAIAELQAGARVLATSEQITPQNGFFLAPRAYARDNAAVVGAVNAALADTSAWCDAHRAEVAQILSDGTGVPLAAMQRVAARSRFRFGPMDQAMVADQQRIADRFHRLGLVPTAIDVSGAAWRATA